MLVVEDEEPCATAMQDVLTGAQCDVEWVGNAEAALETLKDRSFSLAIVDIALPGMDGRALLERMAEDPTGSKIPAIVVSGHVAALPAGAVAFLRKPISASELLTLVQCHALR